MRITLKKRYQFFLLVVVGLVSASVGLSRNNYLSLDNETINSESNLHSKQSKPDSKSLVADIQIPKNSIEKINSSDVVFSSDVFKLTGIIIANQSPIALVTFNNVSGRIVENDRGGNTTSLLPDNVILEKIDIDKSRLLLRGGDRRFVQYLYPQKTLEINN